MDWGRRGWALPYTDRMVSDESGNAFDSGVATRQRASASTSHKGSFVQRCKTGHVRLQYRFES